MSEEERKEKHQRTKITKCFLLVALSCLFFILAMMILWKFILHRPYERLMCGSNLSALGRAMLLYASDYNSMPPTPSKWCDLLIENGGVTKEHFKCRGSKAGPCNYAMNKNVEKYGMTCAPDMVLLFEAGPGWNQAGGLEILTTANHRGEGCNVLFLNNYVYFVRTQDLQKLKWKPDEVQEE